MKEQRLEQIDAMLEQNYEELYDTLFEFIDQCRSDEECFYILKNLREKRLKLFELRNSIEDAE